MSATATKKEEGSIISSLIIGGIVIAIISLVGLFVTSFYLESQYIDPPYHYDADLTNPHDIGLKKGYNNNRTKNRRGYVFNRSAISNIRRVYFPCNEKI